MAGATTTTNSAASAEPPTQTEVDPKQLERTRASLAFLNRIDHVRVTGAKFFDGYERVLFDVSLKDSATDLSERKARKEAKKPQPLVDYSSKKSLATLKSVHQAVHEWSAKHPEPTELDGTSTCAYCRQFNSPAALAMWKWTAAVSTQQQQLPRNDAAGLEVVVNASTIQQYEQCFTSYLECARAVPDDSSSNSTTSTCQGAVYIPAIIASMLANEPTMNSAVAYTGAECQLM